ncbi:hypothetical protein Tsubulata_006514 [Turnera subulata]|uniref:RRM domain-containing protein n=1 Tax=Turnera subulata TaxID=218843 RepID=A0A9Q0F818_9ROSI|nr:hypothetical protein Tsubulata_006514 [Turnera subulata]
MYLSTSPMSPHLRLNNRRPTNPSSSTVHTDIPNTQTPKHLTPQHTHQSQTQTPFFSKWSPKQIESAIANGQAISLYVENIPAEWSPTETYRIMSKYGEVMDVYIPMKRTRRGQRFCFVRFRGVRDTQRLLYDVNRIFMEVGPIRANIARERSGARQWQLPIKQNPVPRARGLVMPTKTYAATVTQSQKQGRMGEGKSTDVEVLTGTTFIPTSETLSWLSRCAVGIIKDPREMDYVHHIWALHGYGEVEVSKLAGNSFLACFPSTDSMQQFLQAPPDWVSLWFDSIKPWCNGMRAETRRCWISVRGLPLQVWCQEFFVLLGSQIGRLIRVDPRTEKRRRLEEARLEILTSQGTFINKTLSVQLLGHKYEIAVVESGTCMESQSRTRSMVEDSESDDDSSAEEMTGDGAGGGGSASDPFQLMPIIMKPGTGVVSVAGCPQRKEFDDLDSQQLLAVSNNQGITNQGNVQLGLSRDAVSGSNSNRISTFNSFDPLTQEVEEVSDADGLNASKGPGVRSPTLSPKANSAQYAQTGYNTDESLSTEDSVSTEVQELRLDWAIQSGRVSRGRKFKKIKKTGSLTSSNSSTNEEIRRVNIRLSQVTTPVDVDENAAFFVEQEARETLNVGDALGWEASGSPQELVSMAQGLVEKEVSEWGRSREHI